VSSATDATTPTPESQTYTNSELGFSFKYPADWDIMEDYMGLAVFVGEPEVLEGDYTVNVSLATEQLSELAEEITVEDYAKQVELNTKSAAPDLNKVDEYSTTIGGQPAIVFTFTATLKVEETKYFLKDSAAVFIKDSVGYIITYDVPTEFYDEYTDSFELVINSFRFQ
jgi:hypothetical protein